MRLRLSPNARLALTVTAPRRSTVTWDYAGASNLGRAVDNCSVADATVTLETPARVHSSRLTGAVAIEHGGPLSPADAPGQ